MKFPEKGLTKEELFKKLDQKKSKDFDWTSKKIFCSVYDGGQDVIDVVKHAYMQYLTENPVDPTIFPSLRDMETEVVAMSADILQGGPEAAGSLTTGGTESILLAVKTAKNRAKTLRPELKHHEIVIPYTIHAAFYKACDYFEITPRVVKVTGDFRADVKAMREAVTENTILIAASAPNYVYGVVDPIREIGQIALDHNIPFHVDGCIGAVVLSFARLGGIKVPEFDFSVPGVTSVSMDLHKYGYAAKGCSVLVHKNKDYKKHQFFVCTEWTGYTLVNPTVLSTKSGGPIAGAWAVLNYLGKEGYVDLSRKTLGATKALVDGINSIEGLEVMGHPDSSVFSFTSNSKKVNIYELMDEMSESGWIVQLQLSNDNSPANIHLTVTAAHVDIVDDFLKVLNEAVEKVKKKGIVKKTADKATIETVRVLANNLSPENFEKIGKLLGFSNGKVPDKFALINQIMDIMPPDTVRKTLLDYMNDFYTYKAER